MEEKDDDKIRGEGAGSPRCYFVIACLAVGEMVRGEATLLVWYRIQRGHVRHSTEAEKGNSVAELAVRRHDV